MLREAIIADLSRKRLNRVAIDLGIFDAQTYSLDELELKFINSRKFTNEVLLNFLTLNELRATAKQLGVSISGVSRSALINQLLSYRKPPRKNKKSEGPNNAHDSNAICTRTRAGDVAVPAGTKISPQVEENAPGGFDISKVPAGLRDCRKTWLYFASKKWVLSSRRGLIISEFESPIEADKWLIAFNEFRNLEHIPAIRHKPPGAKGGKKKAKASSRVSTRKQKLSGLKGDRPETIYKCPVCKTGVTLKNTNIHLDHHTKYEKLPHSLDDQIYDLRRWARKVLKLYRDIEKEKEPPRKVYVNSEDLWVRNRPVSGGGANGTGRRR